MNLNRVVLDQCGCDVYVWCSGSHNGCGLLDGIDGADWHYDRGLGDGYVSVWYPEFQAWSIHYFENESL